MILNKNLNIGKVMIELLYLFACLLIYLYSFLYRRLALLASIVIVFLAYLTQINMLYAVGIVFLLGLIRSNKSGIKDEY